MPWRSIAQVSLVFLVLCAIPWSLLAKKKPPAAPVNLNTATSEELQLVPGIGPVTAEKILQMRKSYGAFKSVDDLSAIRGIGPKRLEKMRKYVTVGKPSPNKTQPRTDTPKDAPCSAKKQQPQSQLTP
jgi:competence protein ComEA